jgi:phosphatidate cytidylyltransferase
LIVVSAVSGASAVLASVAVCLAAALAVAIGESARGEPFPSWPTRLSAVLYAALPLSLVLLMRQWSGSDVVLTFRGLATVEVARGVAWVLLTLSLTWTTDTAAYFVGRSVGRRPFSPRISPNKTWEGTIGGVAAAALLGGMWSQAFHWSVLAGAVLGFAASWAAVFGDLAESSLKRRADVKDSGMFLPGHGGLLDRIDSLAFSTTVVFLVGTLDESTHALSRGFP